MDQLQVLTNYIEKIIPLTPAERDYLLSILTIKKVKKKQFIVQPDFVCRHRTFILKGCLRSYYMDEKGEEHTIAFGVENWWIADFNSYFFQQPATLFVEALEDSTLIQLEYNAEQEMLNKYPAFEKFYRILSQNGYAALQKRILSEISMTATERYQDFEKKYPHIANRVPQYTLASFLGFSTELLSKIRNNRVKKR